MVALDQSLARGSGALSAPNRSSADRKLRIAPARGRRRNAVVTAQAQSVAPAMAERPVVVQPGIAGVETRAPAAPFADANAQTINNTNPNRVGMGDFTRNDGGPPRFMCPLVPGRRPHDTATLPYLLYLPGIDGTGLAAYNQFPGLTQNFQLETFCMPPHDRTPFPRLVEIVEQFLERTVKDFPVERPVYLLGESFGGILAIAVAAGRPDLCDRIVLVNPATSYERSYWPTIGPLLPQVPLDVYSGVPIALAPVLGNPIALAAAGVDRSLPLQQQAGAFAQGLAGLIPQLTALTGILPQPTLQWKLRLLAQGCKFVENRFGEVQQRVLLLIGDNDLLIPSKEEGPRLQKALPRCNLKVLAGRSHALLQEAEVDLLRIMREEGFYVEKRNLSTSAAAKRTRDSFGTTAAIELPTRTELDQLSDQALGGLKRLVSPVFFTRDAAGSVRRGVADLPTDRPLLFVGNHQTYALDIGFVVEALLKGAGVLPRGLAHPVIFEGGGNSDFRNFLQTFGAVKVGPTSFFRLMRNKESVLLYPGGVREAYKNKGEKYGLFWPDEPEFVRVAARFNATIIPLAAVGVEDSVEMLLDAPQLRSLPFVGQSIAAQASQIPQARRGAKGGSMGEESFLAPFSLPRAPDRFYFMLGSPIETSKEEMDDRGRIAEIYSQVKGSLQDEIHYLLQKREEDPYRGVARRLLYETLNQRQAPTFWLPAAPPPPGVAGFPAQPPPVPAVAPPALPVHSVPGHSAPAPQGSAAGL